MKANREQTPLTEWLNGGDHVTFLSRVPDVVSSLAISPIRRVYIRAKSEVVVLFSEKDREDLYKNLSESRSYADFCNDYVTPDDAKFAVVSKILDEDRRFYKAFFTNVVEKKCVDEMMFNAIIAPYLNKEIRFLVRRDPFHPKLGWPFHFKQMTIQDYIEFYKIIMPGLDQEDDTFAMMRICPKCSKLFVAKTNKTIFCSPSCRVMYQRQQEAEE